MLYHDDLTSASIKMSCLVLKFQQQPCGSEYVTLASFRAAAPLFEQKPCNRHFFVIYLTHTALFAPFMRNLQKGRLMKKTCLFIIFILTSLLLSSCIASHELDVIPPELTLTLSSTQNTSPSQPEPEVADQADLIGAWVLTESRIGDLSFTVGADDRTVRVFAENGTMAEYSADGQGALAAVVNVRYEYTLDNGTLTILSFLNKTLEQFKLENPDVASELSDNEIISKYIDLGSVEYSAAMEGELLVLSITLEDIGSFSYVYSRYTDELPAQSDADPAADESSDSGTD